LFVEGQCSAPNNGTYTGALLHGVQQMKDSRLHFGGMEGAEARFVSLGWPTDMDDMSDLHIYAKDLYLVAQAFFDMNFPEYSRRVWFCAFRLGRSRLPVAVAKEFIRELAVKEGHADPAQTVYQYEQMLPHMPRLFRETGDDRKAWIAGVERFRRKDFPQMFRADFGNIINSVLTYVCFLDGTGCVERAFSRLELLELKRRVNHLKAIHVKDALQICLSMPDAIDALVTRVPYPVHRTIADKELEFRILWTPCDRIRNAQRKYLEFSAADDYNRDPWSPRHCSRGLMTRSRLAAMQGLLGLRKCNRQGKH
jgi:hypothetical protein